MPLPTLETPTYELVVPSTKKRVHYRPWLVKEEKILMIALETGDASSIFQAIKSIISVCTMNKVDVDKLCTFDLEFIFLTIRAKSAGEKSEIGIKCEKCEKSNTVEIEIDKIGVVGVDKNVPNKIQLTDSIGVVLRWPTMTLVTEIAKQTEKINEFDMAIQTVIGCIESIYDKDSVYPASEQSQSDLIKFVESLSQDQFRKINEFISAMPRLEHVCNFTCKDCGHSNSIKISGLQNFFA